MTSSVTTWETCAGKDTAVPLMTALDEGGRVSGAGVVNLVELAENVTAACVLCKTCKLSERKLVGCSPATLETGGVRHFRKKKTTDGKQSHTSLLLASVIILASTCRALINNADVSDCALANDDTMTDAAPPTPDKTCATPSRTECTTLVEALESLLRSMRFSKNVTRTVSDSRLISCSDVLRTVRKERKRKLMSQRREANNWIASQDSECTQEMQSNFIEILAGRVQQSVDPLSARQLTLLFQVNDTQNQLLFCECYFNSQIANLPLSIRTPCHRNQVDRCRRHLRFGMYPCMRNENTK